MQAAGCTCLIGLPILDCTHQDSQVPRHSSLYCCCPFRKSKLKISPDKPVVVHPAIGAFGYKFNQEYAGKQILPHIASHDAVTTAEVKLFHIEACYTHTSLQGR